MLSSLTPKYPLRSPSFSSVVAGKYFQYGGFKVWFVSLEPPLLVLYEACNQELQMSQIYRKRLSSHLPGCPIPLSSLISAAGSVFPFLRNLTLGELATSMIYFHLSFPHKKPNLSYNVKCLISALLVLPSQPPQGPWSSQRLKDWCGKIIMYLEKEHLIRVRGRLNSHPRCLTWFLLAPKRQKFLFLPFHLQQTVVFYNFLQSLLCQLSVPKGLRSRSGAKGTEVTPAPENKPPFV